MIRPVVGLVRSALAHRVPDLAAQAAFFAALAMFPMLLAVVTVLRTAAPLWGAGGDLAVAAGTTGVLRIVLGDADAAGTAGRLLVESDTGVLTVGTVAAIVVVVRTLRSVFRGLGVVAGRHPRTWVPALGLAVLLVVGGATAIAVAVHNPLGLVGVPRVVWDVVRWPAMAAALLAWTWVLLRTGTGMRGRVTRRPLVWGAVTATFGWFAASVLLPVYVAVASRFSPTLGAMGGGLVLLVWLYLLMLALFLGAEVAVALRAGPATPAREEAQATGSDEASRPADRTRVASSDAWHG